MLIHVFLFLFHHTHIIHLPVIVDSTIIFICLTTHSSFANEEGISSNSGSMFILIQFQAASMASSESEAAICKQVAFASRWKRIRNGGCFASNLKKEGYYLTFQGGGGK